MPATSADDLLPTVEMPRAIFESIVRHAREGAPEEICGVLRGQGARVDELYRARNVAAERIENYDVDPQTLLLQFEFEEAGAEMMGIYHSHPVSVAYPSATDAWNAHYPDSIYFICSLEHEDDPVIRAFRMTPHFVELDFGALGSQIDFYETRAQLFGYFQPTGAAIPAPLNAVAAAVQPPFYVVFHATAGPDATVEGRVVSVREHPIEIGD